MTLMTTAETMSATEIPTVALIKTPTGFEIVLKTARPVEIINNSGLEP